MDFLYTGRLPLGAVMPAAYSSWYERAGSTALMTRIPRYPRVFFSTPSRVRSFSEKDFWRPFRRSCAPEDSYQSVPVGVTVYLGRDLLFIQRMAVGGAQYSESKLGKPQRAEYPHYTGHRQKVAVTPGVSESASQTVSRDCSCD